MSYADLAAAITKFKRLKDKKYAVDSVIPLVTDPENVDAAIAIQNHLSQSQIDYRQPDEAEVFFDIARFMPKISVSDLNRLMNTAKYLKNKMSLLDMMIKKVESFEADGAANILSSIGKGRLSYADEEVHGAFVVKSNLQTLTAAQLLKLVDSVKYTKSKVSLFDGLILKVSNKNDFESILQTFRSIRTDSQTEISLFWKLRQLEPQMDAERLLALSRVAHTSQVQAKVFEYFEPMTKEKLKEPL